jgi:hypothetical protein
MGTVKKVYRSDCVFVTGIDGGVAILSHLQSLREGQEVASSAFGSHQGVALDRALL